MSVTVLEDERMEFVTGARMELARRRRSAVRAEALGGYEGVGAAQGFCASVSIEFSPTCCRL
jgi:hypothetical protein